jgi:hypothetical protein
LQQTDGWFGFIAERTHVFAAALAAAKASIKY